MTYLRKEYNSITMFRISMVNRGWYDTKNKSDSGEADIGLLPAEDDCLIAIYLSINKRREFGIADSL